MSKESLEALEKNENSIEYEIPKLHHRVLGNLIDILLFVLVFILLFIGSRAIVVSTPYYKSNNETIDKYRSECGLFLHSSERDTWELLPTYYDANKDVVYPTRVINCKTAIARFHDYVLKAETLGEVKEGTYEIVIKDYDDSRLAVKYKGVNLFVWNEDKTAIIDNPNNGFGENKAETYYKQFYHTFILQNCNGYLCTEFTNYYNSMKNVSNLLFFVELPSSFILSAILVYFVPGLFFRRNRYTLGKALYRVGLVNKDCLSVSLPRYIARSAIFIFGEMILSLFTFGIPFIISFTMMLVTKTKQGFPDYMLKCTEVDTSKTKIYKTKYEAAIDVMNERKKAIDFKMINRE